MSRRSLATRSTTFAAALVACGALLFASAASSRAAQTVDTLNPTSRYLTYEQAVYGLSGSTLTDAGPTGLRSWVVLPNGYSTSQCWPVLYLLHAADTVKQWLDESSLYANLPAIVVIPGGGNGQLTNWWERGARSPAWESWFFREFMPSISKEFSICPQRSDHAIAGASMGAQEAMFVATQDPGYFGTAASFSGPLDISDPIIEDGLNTYSLIWGPPGGFYELGYDPTNLLPNLAHTRVFVYTGNGKPVNAQDVDDGEEALIEDVMIHETADFVTAAKRDRIRVVSVQHAGIHDQDNWNISLTDFLDANPFGATTETPASWEYTTVDQMSVAWGYGLDFKRPPATLETFKYANGSLSAQGSGTVSVVEPSGKSFVTKMPFVLAGGKVRSGSSSKPIKGTTGPSAKVETTSPLKSRRAPEIVTFTPSQRLPRGDEYSLDVLQSNATCILTRSVLFAPKRLAKTYTVRLTPGDGKGHPRGEWCHVDGNLAVSEVPRRRPEIQFGALLGHGVFVVR